MNAYGQIGNQAINQYQTGMQGAQISANEASDLRQNAQTEADRLWDMQQTEADRLTNRDDENFNRFKQMIGLLQTADPSTAGQQATSSLADLYKSMGPQLVQYMMSMK